MEKTLDRKRSLDTVSGHEAKRPATIQTVYNGAGSVNSGAVPMRTKLVKPAPPPMRPLNPGGPAAANTPERMRNGLRSSVDELANGRCCVSGGEQLQNRHAEKVHSEVQTVSIPGCRSEVVSDLVRSRVNEIFALLSTPLAERMSSLEEENKQLKNQLKQANERLQKIKEAASNQLKLVNTPQNDCGIVKQVSPQTGVVTETQLADKSQLAKVGVTVATSPRMIHHNPTLSVSQTPTRTQEVSSGHAGVAQAPSGTTAAVASGGGPASLQSPLQCPSLSQQSHVISVALSVVSEPSPPVVVTCPQRRHSSGSSGHQLVSPISSRYQSVTRSHPQPLLDKTQSITKYPPAFDQPPRPLPDSITRPVLLDKTMQMEQTNRLGPPTQVDLTTQMDLNSRSPLHQQWTGSSAHVDHRLDRSPHVDRVFQFDQSAQLSRMARSDCVDPMPHTIHLDQSNSNRYSHTTCAERTDQATNRFDLTRCAERSGGCVASRPQQQVTLTHQLTQESFSPRYYPAPQSHPYETHSAHHQHSHSQYPQPIPPGYPTQTVSYVGNIRTEQTIPSRMPVPAAVAISRPTHNQYGHLPPTYSHSQYTAPSGRTGNMSTVTQQISNRLPTPIVTPQVVQTGIVLQWTLSTEEIHRAQVVDRYDLYAYQGNLPLSPVGNQPDPRWNKVGTVKALPLPMQCTLTQFMKGRTYYFVIRAIDASGHPGAFSKRCTVNLP